MPAVVHSESHFGATEMVREWAKETANNAHRHGHEMEYAEGYKYIKRGD